MFRFRIFRNGKNAKLFDIKSRHEPGKIIDNLKLSLIQETEQSSDGLSPRIYDLELCHNTNSKPLTLCYLKVFSRNLLNYSIVLQKCDIFSE